MCLDCAYQKSGASMTWIYSWRPIFNMNFPAVFAFVSLNEQHDEYLAAHKLTSMRRLIHGIHHQWWSEWDLRSFSSCRRLSSMLWCNMLIVVFEIFFVFARSQPPIRYQDVVRIRLFLNSKSWYKPNLNIGTVSMRLPMLDTVDFTQCLWGGVEPLGFKQFKRLTEKSLCV